MVLKFGTSGYLGNVSLEATTNYSCLRRTLFQIERLFLISILKILFVTTEDHRGHSHDFLPAIGCGAVLE